VVRIVGVLAGNRTSHLPTQVRSVAASANLFVFWHEGMPSLYFELFENRQQIFFLRGCQYCRMPFFTQGSSVALRLLQHFLHACQHAASFVEPFYQHFFCMSAAFFFPLSPPPPTPPPPKPHLILFFTNFQIMVEFSFF